jgi:NIMA (never in mitosis gene a)-related kinase
MKATYKIVKLLGEGSFGKAYLAKCDKEDKKYVIKQVMMDGMTDQEKRETFNEAVILKKLDHPNIIKFKEVFIQRKPNEALNIVTEFADGGDLSQKIEQQKKKPFPESQILDYITQICLALQHIHKKKIIHRDLKSGNVFLMKSGLVKLGDFGIAKGLKSTWEKAKTMVGTPYYLSPEIINSKPYDSKCDIWALGILLYELMTFKMPFNAVSLPLLSIKINRGVYQPPPGTYSSEIKDLLKKCLTLEPEKRPSIDDILQLPLIKNRINNFLNEVQYDQDLFKTMAKKYKDKKKEERHKKKKEKENENDKKDNQDSNKNTNETTHANNDEKKETKKLVNDPNKNREFLQKRKEGKKKTENKPSNTITDKKSSDNISLGDNTKKSLNETNFLIQKKDPNFKQDKVYKEDEIGKTLKEKGYKDLLNEKNGNFDVNKMNEDQYNQLRLLNNLHNVANDLAQDSDSEISVNSSVSSIPSSKSVDIFVEDINLDVPKEKEKEQVKQISKETMQRLKEENKEIENIKKEIEKEIGNDLFKEIVNLMGKSCDKTEVKFDRQLISKNIKDLSNKGFDKAKIDKAEERMDEIFAVLMKDKILV